MIDFKKVCKTYDSKKMIVDHLDMKVNKGEIVVLIGESGCGKTTTMRMLNRLEEISKGQILIEGQDIMKMDPIDLRRRIGYVIQKVGLFPHMTVGENIELVPKLMKWDKIKRKERAMELLDLVDLPSEEYYDRYPSELSGGQQQRVGVARALAVNPEIILMDEPFSALDPITREQLQEELLKLQEELGKTIIFVTHDMDEALKLGDRIAVMKDGKIIQYDTPERILKYPKDEFVEYFVGKDRLWKNPEMVFARDIMDTNVPKVGINRNPAFAIEVMREKKATVLAVVNKQSPEPQKLLGTITRKELSRRINEDQKIRDLMNPELLCVNERMSMMEVLSFMSNNNSSSVFVTNSDGILVGSISESDIVKLFMEKALEYEVEKGKEVQNG